MKWDLIISWRNLWRNPRRTSVILVSVVVGIWMMLFMGAIMWGMVKSMLDTSLSNLTGHIQIHHPKFPDDPAIENRMTTPWELDSVLEAALPAGSDVARRVRLEVVASNARHSGGLTLVGTSMDSAMKMTFLKEAEIEGSLPGDDIANGILVGRKLLEDYETEIGNKLILMARDTNGETASMAFRIVGAFDTFLESNETGFAFVPLAPAQTFLKMGNTITEVSILLPDIRDTGTVAPALAKSLDTASYQVTPWQERIPVVTAYIQIWDTFSFIWGAVVFMAMAFGLVNTLLMAVYERIREFGLVRALGMRGSRIIRGILMESCFLLLVGLAIGNAIAFAVIGWLGVHGIDLSAFSRSTDMFVMSRMVYPELQLRDFLIFNGMVFLLGLLVSLYPAWKAARFTPVEAMTHFN
jgi:ABC-type lipoprotein release transport system permease subunit